MVCTIDLFSISLGPQYSKSSSLVMKAYFHYTLYIHMLSFLYVYINYGKKWLQKPNKRPT